MQRVRRSIRVSAVLGQGFSPGAAGGRRGAKPAGAALTASELCAAAIGSTAGYVNYCAGCVVVREDGDIQNILDTPPGSS